MKPPATPLETLRALQPGDAVVITISPLSSSSPDEVRTVRVIESIGVDVYTQSGHVRPGHMGGGRLSPDGEGILFQPTMLQPVRRVLAIRRVPIILFPSKAA